MGEMVNVALPKGRLGEQVYELFERAGLECPDILSDTRKLFFENREKGLRFFWVKPSDVAVYVGRGAADLGVAGSDVLMEHQPDVYELLDLGLGVCKMMVAAPASFRDNDDMTLRVATKFPNIASRYYESRSRDIDIIELHGSIELAPLLGLSDVIVDIVETGNTLKANGLEPKAEVVSISARLIANKASFKFKTKEIESVTSALAGELGNKVK